MAAENVLHNKEPNTNSSTDRSFLTHTCPIMEAKTLTTHKPREIFREAVRLKLGSAAHVKAQVCQV